MTIKTRASAKAETATTAAKTTKTLSRARKPDAAKVEHAKQAKQADIIDAVKPSATATPAQGTQAQEAQNTQGVQLEGLDRPVTGRGVFAVRTLGSAVSVEAAFLAEDGNVLRLPAVFPNREYALAQVDELRQIVNQHFDELDALAVKGSN